MISIEGSDGHAGASDWGHISWIAGQNIANEIKRTTQGPWTINGRGCADRTDTKIGCMALVWQRATNTAER